MNLLFGVEMASLVDRGRQGAELRQRFICAARQRAGGRRRGRQAGPKAGSGERSGSEGSALAHMPGSLWGPAEDTVSQRREPYQEGSRGNLGFAGPKMDRAQSLPELSSVCRMARAWPRSGDAIGEVGHEVSG